MQQGQRGHRHRAGHWAWHLRTACPQPQHFLWVRPWGWEVCLALLEAPRRQGRSQRAASPCPEEPAAPEGARLADCITDHAGSSAPHSRASRSPWEARGLPQMCLGRRERAHWKVGEPSKQPRTPAPCGCPGWDLCLPGSPQLSTHQMNQPHTGKDTHTLSSHEHRVTYMCTYRRTGPTGAHRHADISVVTHPHTHEHRYCTLTCSSYRLHRVTCTYISYTQNYPRNRLTHGRRPTCTLSDCTHAPQDIHTYPRTVTDLYFLEPLECLDRGQQWEGDMCVQVCFFLAGTKS